MTMRAARHAPLLVFALTLALVASSCSSGGGVIAPRYALVYGVKEYLYRPLTYTVLDAQGVASTAIGKGWNASNVIEREDAAVTKSQIRSDILSLANVSADSTVLVYFSGHGTFADQSWGNLYPTYSGGYVVPFDAVNAAGLGPATVNNLISPGDLVSWLSQIGTKNVIVILDCCNSGAFVSPGGAIDASPQDYSGMPAFSAFSTAFSNFGSLLTANATASGEMAPIVIAAAGTDESSYDGTTAMQHGVFTYFLLQGATNGDSNGDGLVTTTEAFAYAQKAIVAWGSSLTNADYALGYLPFLPHISGGTRDLVLFGR
jgi:uncharacterized caspase-like protein